MKGYCGKILRIDLTKKQIEKENLTEKVCKKIIGGSGLGAYYLYKEVESDVDPFDSENKIIFATGPFQATNLPGSAKWSVISKSPANSFYGDSAASAHWGRNLKRAGYDALIVEGKSEIPVFISIDNEEVNVVEAPELWGMDSFETTDHIVDNYGKEKASIAAIGQAGENKVSFSCITVEKKSFAGRSGLGAVMGSKNLKAIGVNGTKGPALADEDKVKKLQKDLFKKLRKQDPGLREGGTPSYMTVGEEFGDVPIKNWRKGSWEKGNAKLGTPIYNEQILERPWPCPACPMACHRKVKVDSPPKYKMEGAGPEYETLAMVGENCLVDNLPAVAKANELCNRYSLDTISTGASIAFAMECYEKGFLTKDDMDGLDLQWGNADAAIELIKKIGEREGFGEILAHGVTRAAEEIDPATSDFAIAAKGVELPAHDPRAFFGIAVNYATGVRGPGHERGNLQMPYQGILLPELGIENSPERYGMEGTDYLAAKYQDWSSFWNSLVVCRFQTVGGMTYTDMLDCLNAITGWELSIEDSAKLSEGIFQLQRLVNVKYGVSKDNDTLPRRIFEATDEGGHPGKVPQPLEPILKGYYELRGWNENGIPRSETVDKFGLDEIIDYTVDQF